VTVSDQGIGIPAAALPHLFTRFYRAPNAEAWHISGMGIGLYVAQEIIRLHEGEIQVTSEEGKGSSFTLSLPPARTPVETASREYSAAPV
jgi:signal transduction histidine kinase